MIIAKSDEKIRTGNMVGNPGSPRRIPPTPEVVRRPFCTLHAAGCHLDSISEPLSVHCRYPLFGPAEAAGFADHYLAALGHVVVAARGEPRSLGDRPSRRPGTRCGGDQNRFGLGSQTPAGHSAPGHTLQPALVTGSESR
jgi:hypothetical protein